MKSDQGLEKSFHEMIKSVPKRDNNFLFKSQLLLRLWKITSSATTLLCLGQSRLYASPSSLSFHQRWNSCSRNFPLPPLERFQPPLTLIDVLFAVFFFLLSLRFQSMSCIRPPLCVFCPLLSCTTIIQLSKVEKSLKRRGSAENNTRKKKYLLQRLKWIAKLLSFLTTHLDHHSSNRLSRSLDFHLSYLDSRLYSDSLSWLM